LAAIAARQILPDLGGSLVGPVPKGFWYLSRASGFVGYGLLWLSMALGLLITNKLARAWPGGPAAFDLHQHVSLLGLGFSAFHALVLLADPKIGFRLAPLLLPFGISEYRPFWVGLGHLALYLLAVVTLSFYIRKWIGKRTWRLLHYGSFGLFFLALAHGLFSGPDSEALWAQGLYWFTGLSLLFLTLYRVRLARGMAGMAGKKSPTRPREPAYRQSQ
jgi:predicted ferric reductase